MAPFCFHKAFIYTCPTKGACKSLDIEKDKLRTDIQKQLNIRNGFSAVSYKKQGETRVPKILESFGKIKQKINILLKVFSNSGYLPLQNIIFCMFFLWTSTGIFIHVC